MPKKPVLAYLHGFNSSPDALKAKQVEEYIAAKQLLIEYLRPCIPDTPDKAELFLDNFIKQFHGRSISLIGSSMGGFYATWLAEKYNLKAILVNPAVRPHELMQKYLGENRNPYSGAIYQLTEMHMETLQSLYVPVINRPENYLVLLQTGDEVLNATEASQRFYQSRCLIEYGGDHRFQGFERYMPQIFSWLALE